MKPILVGQFFKEYVGKQKNKTLGWTVVFVESGEYRDAKGATQHGLARVTVVRNDTRVAAPNVRGYREVEELINSATWIATSAPQKRRVQLPESPPDRTSGLLKAERKRLKIRQSLLDHKKRRMEIIRPLVELGQDLYIEDVRTLLLNKIAVAHRLSAECVRQYLCLWWQFGCSSEGLYPRNSLSGQKSFNARRSRAEAFPTQYPFVEYKTGPKPSGEVDPGMAMGPSEIQKCRKGAKDFLFQPSPDHKLRYNWISAWTNTKNRYFDREVDPTNPAPSRRQFETAVRSDPEFAHRSIKIVGALPFERNNRQQTSRSRSNVSGPGQLGQLDDVTSKVILVDELTKRPLGTCRIFVLSDTWSGTIAGAHDTLEGSNFEEAKQGLLNAFSDKAAFRESQGLTFDLKYVPCSGVFKNITTDGGPFAGDLANDIPESLSNVSNTASYRPDLKSDIESSFHAYLVQLARELPGYNRQGRCRGDDDPKILAYLTPTEFRRIFWDWLAMYSSRSLKGWLPAEAMGVENPPDPSPYALWNWGLIHCGGALREKSPEELQRALLARGEGTLTSRRGVNFKGLVYVLENGDNTAAGLFPSRPVKILYDTKYARRIFIDLDGSLVVAKLIPELDRIFGHLPFKSIEHNKKRLDARRRAIERQHHKTRERLAAQVTAIKKEALKIPRKDRKRAAHAVSIDVTRVKQQRLEDQRRAAKAETTLFKETKSPDAHSHGASPIEVTTQSGSSEISILDFIT